MKSYMNSISYSEILTYAVFLFNRIKLGVLFNIIDCVMP